MSKNKTRQVQAASMYIGGARGVTAIIGDENAAYTFVYDGLADFLSTVQHIASAVIDGTEFHKNLVNYLAMTATYHSDEGVAAMAQNIRLAMQSVDTSLVEDRQMMMAPIPPEATDLEQAMLAAAAEAAEAEWNAYKDMSYTDDPEMLRGYTADLQGVIRSGDLQRVYAFLGVMGTAQSTAVRMLARRISSAIGAVKEA